MPITRDDLRGYQRMKIALEELDDEIRESYNTYRSPQFASDGSQKQLSANSPTERALRHTEALEGKRDRLLKRMGTIDEYVDGIDDYLVQAIVRDHYIRGLTWEATCRHLRKHENKSSVIRLVDVYMEQRRQN